MKNRKYSTVEMTVLGMTWLRGPCTVYSVMKELSSSASTYHKSRAGTAYLTVSRLEKLGLVSRVGKDQIQVTPEGEQALRDWTGPEVPMAEVAHSADLLRLRFFFLEVLPPEQRLEFIDRSIEQLEEFLVRCRTLVAQNQEIGDYYGALATVCVIKETQARMEWLALVRPFVAEPLSKQDDWSAAILKALG